MLNNLPPDQQTYIVTGYTDLRRSIDGLATIVQAQVQLYKRLDNGKFQWLRSETEALLLTTQQRRWLLEGLKIEQPKAIREGRRSVIY